MSRSDAVQHKYRELLVDPHLLSTVFLQNAHYNMVDPELVDELKGLKEDLVARLHEIINTKMTPRQRDVMMMYYFESRTQMEVADKLGLCQTTIHKILHGNIDYSNGKKRYGGAMKKIKALCEEDEVIQKILERMKEINMELSLGGDNDTISPE